MAMQKLSNDIQSLICSSSHVASYKNAVEELVYNSIDADSTSIAIRVNLEEHSIQVIDNGTGIPRYDFTLLGQRCATSKLIDLKTLKSAPNKYGFKGQSLSNIIEVSQNVKIISRFQSTEETWVKNFKTGKEGEVTECAQRPSKGTTVEIKGFLYNLNIQRKSVNPLTELQNIKTFLEQISLNHTNVSFSLRDDSKNEIIFKLRKNRDMQQTLSILFDINKTDLQELIVEKKEYKLLALIGKRDRNVNERHWIYLNGKYLHNSKLHKIINENFTKALGLKKNKRNVKSKNIYHEEETINYTNTIPTYFIFITCPYYDYDSNHANKQTILEFKCWDKINKLLHKLVEFYVGDGNFKEIKHQIDNKQQNGNETRVQVKKIMQKILGSASKKYGVSQMQNGVKGKLMKRINKQKKKSAISLSKIILSKNHGVKCIENHSVHLPKITSKVRSKNDIVKGQPFSNNSPTGGIKPMHLIETNIQTRIATDTQRNNLKDNQINIINSVNKVTPKKPTELSIHTNRKTMPQKVIKTIPPTAICTKSRHPFKKKDEKNYVNKKMARYKNFQGELINKFEQNTDSVKRRCNALLAKHFDDLLNKKKNRQIFVNETIQYSNVIRDNKNYSVRKKINEFVIHDYIPTPSSHSPCTFDNRVWDCPTNKLCKSAHDLLQTVLQSQSNYNQDENIDIPKKVPSLIHKYEPNYEMCTKATLTPKGDNFRLLSDINKLGHSPSIRLYDQPCNKDNFESSLHPTLQNMTFQSHQYCNSEFIISVNNDKHTLHRRKNKQFISKLSKDNFVVLNDSRKCRRNIQRIFKKKYLNRELCHKRHNYTKHQEQNDTSYSIEYFTSANKWLSSKEVQQNEKSLGLTCFNDNQDELVPHEHKKSLEIGGTYTVATAVTPNVDVDFNKNIAEPIEITGEHGSGTMCTRSKDPRGTCFIQDFQTHNEVNKSENNEINNMDVVFISNSQDNTLNSSNKIYPINVCETILDYNKLGQEELQSIQNISFHDSLFNFYSLPQDRNDNDQRTETRNGTDEISHHFNRFPSTNSGQIFALSSWHKTNKKVSENKNATIMVEKRTVDPKNGNISDGSKKNTGCDTVEENNFDLKNRLRFVPKGMSQIFENCQTKNVCDYNLDRDYFEESIYNNFINDVQVNTEIFEPGIQNVKEFTTKNIEKVNDKLNKDNASLTFEGPTLKEAKVFGQVDSKFIAAKVKGQCQHLHTSAEFLILFDQHAVHERIRLERNLADYLNGEQWNSIRLDDFTLKLSEDDVTYLHNFKDKFTQFGLKWRVLSGSEVSITSIPEAILGKNPRQAEVVIKAVKNLILEEINAMKSQKGCITLYPKSIMDLVYSEACRYAIKFGDKLSATDCVELLHSLSECKTPFQCAHGRPVMAVLMEVKSEIREYKINLSKLLAFKNRCKK